MELQTRLAGTTHALVEVGRNIRNVVEPNQHLKQNAPVFDVRKPMSIVAQFYHSFFTDSNAQGPSKLWFS